MYTWDEDNRLLQVDLPGGTSVEYTYDVQGRMLTRTDGSGTTNFEWDGFDCIRESAPPTGSAVYDTATYDSSDEFGSGGVTQYYVVNGQLRALVRDNALFTVSSDALGSVRLVTDNAGTVISHFDYDAWGNVLASSFDNLAAEMPHNFTGCLGCRSDSSTGLIYMRQRWYEPSLIQRFVSRDAILGTNRYVYAGDNPAILVDPLGLCIVTVRYSSVVEPFTHASITTQDSNGITNFRAGPGSQDASNLPTLLNELRKFGNNCAGVGTVLNGDKLVASSNPFNDENIDWDPEAQTSIVLLDDGLPCDGMNALLNTAINNINAAQLPYSLAPELFPGTYNSNSAAAYMLQTLELTDSNPSSPANTGTGTTRPVPLAPGFSVPLPVPVPKPAPMSPPLLEGGFA